MEKTIALSQKQTYTPTRFTEFLWWLSTAEKELLADAVVDRNRHKIIGMTVLPTWAFTTLAWTYFFSTVATNTWLAIPLGFFISFIILTIDRALIKGINKFSKNKIMPLLFRGLLAVVIGTFMAQPALLYMFKKEIRLQTSLDNEKKKPLKSEELNNFYKPRKVTLTTEKENLQKDAASKYADVAKARESFLAETDGSGGTGKMGIMAVAIAKRNEYQKLDGEYQQFLSKQATKLTAVETRLKTIEETIKKEEAAFTEYFNDRYLTQIEALNNLIKTNPALQFRYYLLVIILLLIEVMPVIAKKILSSGIYDERVRLREAMEKEMATSNIGKEQELKELYSTLAHQNDQEALTNFFNFTKDDRNEKIKSFSKEWKEGTTQSFGVLWETMKKNILTRQEH